MLSMILVIRRIRLKPSVFPDPPWIPLTNPTRPPARLLLCGRVATLGGPLPDLRYGHEIVQLSEIRERKRGSNLVDSFCTGDGCLALFALKTCSLASSTPSTTRAVRLRVESGIQQMFSCAALLLSTSGRLLHFETPCI